jgi:hypothetical protein
MTDDELSGEDAEEDFYPDEESPPNEPPAEKKKVRGKPFQPGNKMNLLRGKSAPKEKSKRGPGRPPKSESAPKPVPVLAPEPAPEPVPSPPSLPEPTEPAPPSKTWRCPARNCGALFENELGLIGHIRGMHKNMRYDGGAKMPEGVEFGPREMEDVGGGFMVDTRQPVDMMGVLRKILENNGITDSRESIVDLFQYEDPTNVKRLELIMAKAGIAPNKRNMASEQWGKYMENMGMIIKGEEEEGRKKTRSLNPSMDDIANWTPLDWQKYMLDAQKQMMAMKMLMTLQTNMMKSMDLSGAEAGMMGLSTPSSDKLPPAVQAQLDRLKQYEERDKFKEVMDPLYKEFRALRGDLAETIDQRNKEPPKKTIMETLLEMQQMRQMFQADGDKESAEKMRIAMEGRIATQKLEMEKEMKLLQMEYDKARDQAHVLEMQNIKTELNAKLDQQKTLTEIAARDKAEDLEATITKALKIQQTLKQFSGDQESDDDKRMKAIMGTIQGTVESFKGPISDLARGWADKQAQAKAASVPAAAPPQYAPRQGRAPQRVAGSEHQHPMAQATCPDPACGTRFQVDTTQPTAECPGCHMVYNFGPPPPGTPSGGPPMGDMDAKRRELLSIDRAALDEYASENGIDPTMYPTKESLVDAVMGR